MQLQSFAPGSTTTSVYERRGRLSNEQKHNNDGMNSGSWKFGVKGYVTVKCVVVVGPLSFSYKGCPAARWPTSTKHRGYYRCLTVLWTSQRLVRYKIRHLCSSRFTALNHHKTYWGRGSAPLVISILSQHGDPRRNSYSGSLPPTGELRHIQSDTECPVHVRFVIVDPSGFGVHAA